MNKNKVCYITYQTFPATTANSQQTISNIKYLIKNGCKLSLVFPLREPQSSTDISKFKEQYLFDEELQIFGIPHNYPFGKINFFNRLFFHLSHFLWSKKIVKNILTEQKDFDYFITRSDWVFYFLTKRNKKVIFECHQLSKIRKLILMKGLKNPNSKVIFLNDHLLKFFSNHVNEKNSIVLHNAVDLEEFKKVVKNKKKEIVFVGNLNRFNKDRGIKYIIDGYKYSKLSTDYKLKIIGGPDYSANKLREEIKFYNGGLNIKIIGRLGRSETINNILDAEIGILMNTSENEHSKFYTSPLKYFEYLAANLKIIGVDFPAHRALPFSEDITFFKENDLNSLIEGFNNLLDSDISLKDIGDFSLDTRAKKIIKFISK